MKSIRHMGIAVSNMTRSLDFYSRLFGLQIVKETNEGGHYISKLCDLPEDKSNIRTIKLAADDGNLIELIEYEYCLNPPDKNIMCQIRTCHIAFTVNDISAEYKRLNTAGISFLSEPQFSPDSYAKVVFCRDPDGVFIELVEVL